MDWNWFFSAVAQSFAAIVGIGSAFIITKIINNNSEFNRKKNDLNEIYKSSIYFLKEFEDTYIRYKDCLFSFEIDKISKRYMDTIFRIGNKNNLNADHFYNYFSTRIREIFADKEVKDKLNEQIHHIKSTKTSDIVNPDHKIPAMINKYRLHKFDDDNEKTINKSINDDNNKLKVISRDISLMKIKIDLIIRQTISNPEKSLFLKNTIILMAILFFIGVIIPLLFLPYQSNLITALKSCWFVFLLKFLILIISSIIFYIFLYKIYKINSALEYDKNVIEELKEILRYDKINPWLFK